MDIRFTDFFDNEMNKEEALMCRSYKKKYYENSRIKKIEEFYLNEIDSVLYYKNDDEIDDDILNIVKSEIGNSTIIKIISSNLYGNFIIESEKRYSGDFKSLPSEFRYLKDGQDRYICSEGITQKQYFPNESHIHKAFYSKKIFKNLCEPDIEMGLLNSDPDPIFLVFSVDYNLEGKIEYADFNPLSTYDRELYSADNFSELAEKCELLPEWIEYYLTAEFYPIPQNCNP